MLLTGRYSESKSGFGKIELESVVSGNHKEIKGMLESNLLIPFKN